MSYEVKGDRVMDNIRFAAIPICCRHLRLRYVDFNWNRHPTSQPLNDSTFSPSHLQPFGAVFNGLRLRLGLRLRISRMSLIVELREVTMFPQLTASNNPAHPHYR